jgi:hypothetical protein
MTISPSADAVLTTNRTSRVLVIGGVILVAVLLATIGMLFWRAGSERTVTFGGGVTVEGDWLDRLGTGQLVGDKPGDCRVSEERYPDVQVGQSVTVRDAAGAIVANATLGAGRLVNSQPADQLGYSYKDADKVLIGQCRLLFTASNVPASDFYTLTVGSHDPVTVDGTTAASGTIPDVLIPYIRAG